MKKLLFVLLAWLAAVGFAFAAIDINNASEAELDKLPGIGPAKAKAIVEDRQKNGPFKSAEDLKRVKGIGDKTFDKLKSEITVSGGAAKAAAKPAAAPAAAPVEAKKDAKAEAKKEAKAEAKKEAKAEAKKEDKGDAKKTDKAEKKAKDKEAKGKDDKKDKSAKDAKADDKGSKK